MGGVSLEKENKKNPQKTAEIVARATGLEPVTYGLFMHKICTLKMMQNSHYFPFYF